MSNQPKAHSGEYSLLNHTDYYLQTKGFPRFSAGGLRPTESGVLVWDATRKKMQQQGGCRRAIWMRMKGLNIVRVEGKNARLRNEVGKQVENTLVDNWREMGIFIDRSVRYKVDIHGTDISGELDAILEEPGNGVRYIAECKSMYGYYASKEIFGNKTQKGKPKTTNLLQALTYCYYFKYLAPEHQRLSYVVLFYVERGDGEHGHFIVDIDRQEEEMDDGTKRITHQPFFISFTDGKVPHRVNLPFLIEGMLENNESIRQSLQSDEPPERDYQLSYPPELIEELYKNKQIGKTKYDDWKKHPKSKDYKIGDWQCDYCGVLEFCYDLKTLKPIEFDQSLIRRDNKLHLPVVSDLEINIEE